MPSSKEQEREGTAAATRTGIRTRTKKVKNLAGTEFPAFRVIGQHGPQNGIYTMWDCICKVCGKPCVIVQTRLPGYKSCGCLFGLAQADLANRRSEYALDGTAVNTLLSSRKMNKNSSTGARGVSIIRKGDKQRYRAYINLRRKRIDLGQYDNLDDAIAARKAGEDLYYRPVIEEWTRLHGHEPAPRGKYQRTTEPSGLPRGIQKHPNSSRYFASFSADHLVYKVGSFATVEAAVKAREKAIADFKAGRPVHTVPYRSEIDFDMKAARVAAGLSRKQLGDMLGVKDATIGLWERGKTHPYPEVLDRIKEILNVDKNDNTLQE